MSEVKPTLLIMAAGMGSRYGGLKQIDPVGPNGEIIMDYSLYDAKRAGFERVIFVIKEEFHKDFKNTIGRRIEPHMDCLLYTSRSIRSSNGFRMPPKILTCWRSSRPCTGSAVNHRSSRRSPKRLKTASRFSSWSS